MPPLTLEQRMERLEWCFLTALGLISGRLQAESSPEEVAITMEKFQVENRNMAVSIAEAAALRQAANISMTKEGQPS